MSRLPDRETRARLPEDGGPDHNRLVHSQSPYLLQHAANPVDWYPWGEEAFARAREFDRPIFLSVGYSTCHWCHVMERESFENPTIAACLDEHYVAIKVDREERPELDEIYMTVTQLMTGRGGWPNSVWLTPDGRPWYAGTYFPPDDRGDRPGFLTLLRQLAAVWTDRRADVEEQASQIVGATRELSETRKWIGEPRRELVDSVLLEIERAFDETHGGFGTAPKFPPHGALALIVDELERRPTPNLEAILAETLRAMARGGLHDQVGGGFHRYSTDQVWLLPHFEKMLYDNAPLALAYAEAAVRFGDDEFRRTAHRTYEWVLDEMTDPGGGFHSAQDADSEGEEGRFYVWTVEELQRVLGPESARWVSEVMAVDANGNFRDEATRERTGANVLHWSGAPAEVAGRLGLSVSELWDRWNEERTRLAAARAGRPRPAQDDKVIAAWNGLMIQSLARGGRRLSEPRYVEAARSAADFLLAHLVTQNGTLLRTYREGEARIPGYLEDYAAVIDGLVELHEAGSDARYLDAAETLADRMVEQFFDDTDGGFFFVGAEHESVLVRTKDVFDQAVPSGNGLAALALERLGRATNHADLQDRAWRTVAALQGAVLKHPRGTETLTRAMARLLATPREVEAGRAAEAGDRIQRNGWEARLDVGRVRVAPDAPLPWTVGVEPRGDGRRIEVSSLSLVGPDAERWGDFETQSRSSPSGGVVIEGWVRAPEVTSGASAVLLELELAVEVCEDERCTPSDRIRLAVAVVVRPPSA